jgi:SSS family solute:Na+ symporter
MVSITILAFWTKRYTQSVADFLSANRCAGRYLLTMAAGMSSLAVVSSVAAFEMYYEAGFSPSWWLMSTMPLSIILAMTGYIIYRFRETRVFTLGQFFEIRYSKKYRIFMGMLAWLSGIINFGIFPAVGSRFFIYFCGLPTHFDLLGITCSTYVVTMLILIGLSLLYILVGGQIAVMLTDFGQAAFCNIALIILLGFLLLKIPWSSVFESLQNQPPRESMLNPLDTSGVDGFGLWYFLIGYLWLLIQTGNVSWQGAQGYNVSARDAHELRMAYVLGFFRATIYSLMIIVLAISAYVVMHHGDYSSLAATVNQVLNSIDNEYIRKQVTVSTALSQLFPVGLMGVLCAVMLAAFVSTNDTYLQSWGSIFIQDVVVPLRKKPLTPKQHLWLLRLSITFVAVFVFIFALFFKQYEYIFMYFWITGAIFTGGVAGPIIGGLYWKNGTTAAAWISSIYGSLVSVGSIILSQLWEKYHTPICNFLQAFFPSIRDTEDYPINGYYMAFAIAVSAFLLYIIVSLLTHKEAFNIEKMLHRGKYAPEKANDSNQPQRGFSAMGYTKTMPWKDKGVFLAVGTWFLFWFLVFIIFTVYELAIGMSESGWSRLWQVSIYSQYGLMLIVSVWFLVGGARDVKTLFADLRSAKRNDRDDGTVVDHQNLDDRSSITPPNERE